ncbi:hypothetical protein D9619_004089 [Psilocybe cf. subviscida]|uniref:NACHT domain-containing protein n=1 Tax=Psilocybe cf. subviscida TaxID=2480587 RepID=A0A8H5BR06_9AGAR|nr:hypothetical protein D9619_004089 [Psilocybe cf. subviscida]
MAWRRRKGRSSLEQRRNSGPASHGVDGVLIPADALLGVLASYKDASNGVDILDEDEMSQFQAFLAINPGLGINVNMLLDFLKLKTELSPSPSPPADEDPSEHDFQFASFSHSRSESSESYQTFYAESSSTSSFFDGSTSRPPSRGPVTPMKSAFDSDRRQRSTPLNAAPSSWAKRPQPAGRRKSDAGSRSDSEPARPPSAFGRRNSNTQRTPSVPSSPSMGTTSFRDGPFSPGSPDFNAPRSRPHSRARSHNDFSGYMSPPDDGTTMKRPMSRYDAFEQGSGVGVSSVRMPRSGGGSDSDEDEEDEVGMHLVMDRLHTDSTVSMEMTERLEALQRTNEELGRKRADAEMTLQKKLSEHEYELEELNQRIEELRSELAASNREEKELRAKDSRNMAQITALEAEVAKVSRTLELSRQSYGSLQKQYQEQCSISEKYRDDLRTREETINTLKEAVSLHEIETNKWTREHDAYEERIALLQRDLETAMEAHGELEEQKQENMMLKETIDRVRFEMDMMRQSLDNNGVAGGSGHGSAASTMSRSLGAELQGQLGEWEQDGRDEIVSEGSTAVEDDDTEGEDDGDEDVIETIITKRKRKVASRAQVIETSTRREFEEVKEYSDGSTQYDPTLFAVNHGMQTDPEPKVIYASFEVQTDEMPEPEPRIIEVAPAPRITMEMEIQTDAVEVAAEPSRSPSPAPEESMASSSSTIVPPTPKPSAKHLADQLDEPPAYNQVTEADKEEREWRLAADTLKKWHQGVQIPLGPVAGGVSEETAEDWKAIKRELGVDCMVIDRLIAASTSSADAAGTSTSVDGKTRTAARRRGRFYNIYNTYVYGDKGSGGASLATNIVSYGLMAFGAGALAVLAVAPHMASQDAVPGGATYYDRAAWNSFNSFHGAGEGFAPDGTAVVWSFLGRVGGGAARMAPRPRRRAGNILQSASNVAITGGTFIASQKNGNVTTVKENNTAPNAILNAGGRADEVKCFPGTREEVLAKMEAWIGAKEPNRERRVFWLSGPAGGGKSAIVQTLAERCMARGVPMVNFFFFRGDTTRNHARPIVATLVCQLLESYPELKPLVEAVLVDKPLILGQPLRLQFEHLIQNTVRTITNPSVEWQPIVILIDGLDECDSAGKLEQQTLLQVLHGLVSHENSPFIVLIASRPEPHLTMTFNEVGSSVESIFLNEDYRPSDDIRLFVVADLARIRNTHHLGQTLGEHWPSESSINSIVEKSSGQFIYAATILRFIATSSASPAHSLDKVQGLRPVMKSSPFAELDAIYTYVLSQAEDWEAAKDVLAAQIFIGTYFNDLAREYGPNIVFVRILQPLGREPDDLASFVSDLVAIVRFNHDKQLEFYHASLRDFLLDSTRSGVYHIDLGEFTERLAAAHIKGIHDKYLESVDLADMIWKEITAPKSNMVVVKTDAERYNHETPYAAVTPQGGTTGLNASATSPSTRMRRKKAPLWKRIFRVT